MNHYQLIISGNKVPTQEHLEIRNPSTGAVVGLAPLASTADLDHAVAAANVAFAKWSKIPDTERRALCHEQRSSGSMFTMTSLRMSAAS